MSNFDFTKIKGDTVEAQRSYFEQLVCHLAQLDGGGGEFRRIEGAGGDGGVEALRILQDGQKVGYQAKYYPSRDDIDWSKLDKSVDTALINHSELKRYIIALACDFTGKRAVRGGTTEGIWGKWDTQVKLWEAMATQRGMQVKFEPWTAFDLQTALSRPTAQHLIPFFFDQLAFTRQWMQRHLDRTLHDLQARYSPAEHVDTKSVLAFNIIHRRDDVVQHLRAIFEVARGSDPRAAAALLDDPDLVKVDVAFAEGRLREFLSLENALNWGVERAWPVCEWITTWYACTRALMSLGESIKVARLRTGSAEQRVVDHKVAGLTREYDLIGPEVFGAHVARMLQIDGSRAALFVGRAGAGKSHLLARGAEIAWAAGAPVIHILGQHIGDGDPRASVLQRLGLATWSFQDALSALNLAAEAANTRALLIIDALNEAREASVWRNHLASFIREVNENERIVLVVSCREEYLNYVVPPELIANPRTYPHEAGQAPEDCAPLGKLVPVFVSGFQTMEEREAALRKFMDEKGIARPTAPVLDDEFFNPLFMSSVCRSMAAAKVTVFPRGLHGAREIFEFVLKTKARALGTRHDHNPRLYEALRDALSGLAEMMVEKAADHVPLHDAINRIDVGFEALSLPDHDWLEVLERSDILRRDVEASPNAGVWSRPNEVIRFSFQRLQDNLIAEHLISKSRKIDVEDAFDVGGPFAFLVRRSTEGGVRFVRFAPEWVGVAGALWAAVAESYGKELLDLRSFFRLDYPREEFRRIFQASIRERKGTAFTTRTRQILASLWSTFQTQKIAILLSTSCVPGHAWNADSLNDQLHGLSLKERQEKWSLLFMGDQQSEMFRRASSVAEWALNVNVETADSEVVRLAATTLTWLCAVENPAVRELATRGLRHLLIGAPILSSHLIDKFHDVEDPAIKACLTGGS